MIFMVSNARLVAMGMSKNAMLAPEKVHGVMLHHGQLLQTRAKARASGRPGPRTVTGDYRRSISRRTTRTAHGSRAEVGSNNPQARRLEFGFTGRDSLGRFYDQPPFPHYGPALDETVPGFMDDLGRAVVDLL